MQFICVENRIHSNALAACKSSAEKAGYSVEIISKTDPKHSDFFLFSEKYKHYSPNSAEFELACIRRYFLLREYVASHDLREFVLLDSDVLLFKGVDQHIKSVTEGQSFSGSQIFNRGKLEKQISPHVSYWNREAIEDFTKFVLKFYSTPGRFEGLRHQLASEGQLGISDMTLLSIWASQTGQVRPINRPHNGGVIDHNISMRNSSDRTVFRMSYGNKKIFYGDHGPFFQLETGERLRAFAIHCQGKAKLNMNNILYERSVTRMSVAFSIMLGKRLRDIKRRLSSTARAK